MRVSFYEMLDRVGFDLDPVRGQVGTDRKTLAQAGFVPNRQLLFSPFQQLDARPLSEAFHEFTPGVRTLQSAIVSATAEAREPTSEANCPDQKRFRARQAHRTHGHCGALRVGRAYSVEKEGETGWAGLVQD